MTELLTGNGHRFGNFDNYYNFHSATERLDLIPTLMFAELWKAAKSPKFFWILDVGCNDGTLTKALLSRAREEIPIECEVRIVGVDIDESLIERAKLSACANAHFCTCDFMHNHSSFLSELGLDSVKFNCITFFSITMWIHINCGDAALPKLFELSRSLMETDGCTASIIIEPQPWKCYRTAKKRCVRNQIDFPPYLENVQIKDVDTFLVNHYLSLSPVHRYYWCLGKESWGRSLFVFFFSDQGMKEDDQLNKRARTEELHTSTLEVFGKNYGTLSGIDTTKFNEDTVIEGLRIPANLDTITNVNFVLTQEKGKLKPKDLKAAIEKNRAEKRRRAEEQEKLRMAGGGVGPGMLDLRAILADDSLNVSDADPFKRQLREMAFLADVEDVRKLETEKEFRISEVYLGSYHLSEEDISQILKQREDQELFKKKSEWRRVLDRNRTELHPPVGNGKKAGASIAVSNEVIQQLTPHFDANRNDVWSKRMNTLRRFVSLTSKWIMRERVRRRFQTVLDTFHRANAYTRTEVLQFIQEENANYRSKNGASSSGSAAGALEGGGAAGRASLLQDTGADPPQGWTLAQVVCAMPNEWLETRLAQEAIISQSNTYELAAEMVKRFLFPRFEADESTQRLPMTMKPVAEDAQFDDKTYFQLKLRPEWQALRYGKHTAPTCPMVFAAQPYLPMRTGAPEECALRYPADKHVPLDTVLEAVYPSAEGGVAASAVQLLDMWTVMEASSSADTARTEGELTHAPSTLFTDPAWHNYEMDFFRTKHEHRSYHSLPVRSEMDPDYALRPFAKTLLYDPDTSLRSRWLQEPGFASTNFYALGAAETRDWSLSAEVLPRPAPGPSLVDFYFPDLDRHTSGLHCYELDHQRSLQEHDLDVAPLQSKMATEDHLTDSESDDDEAYVTQKPTLTIVRRILHGLERMAVPEPTPLVASSSAPPAKGVAPTKAAGNKGAPEPAPAPTSPEPKPSADDESIAEPDGDNLQVELLRDRKILEMESYLKKLRQQSSLTISERLETMAAATPCLLQRAVVQRPIHIYEESLVRALQEVKPPAQQGGYTEAIGTMLLSPTKSVRASDDFSVTSAFTNNK